MFIVLGLKDMFTIYVNQLHEFYLLPTAALAVKESRCWPDFTDEQTKALLEKFKVILKGHRASSSVLWSGFEYSVPCCLTVWPRPKMFLLWSLDWSPGSLLPLEACELESLSAGKTTRLAASRLASVRENCVRTLNISKHLGGVGEYYDEVDGSSLNWHLQRSHANWSEEKN